MTDQQLKYQANREQERYNRASLEEARRSNLAREHETNRSNRAQETETYRSNLAREREQNRSNLARENETYRSNRAKESINLAELQVKQHQAESQRISAMASSTNATANVQNAGTNLYSAQIKELEHRENVRHNTVTELNQLISGVGKAIGPLLKTVVQ